ncbi:MAG: HEAT repeat domain-containing protein, partial [Planctomycetes bacterium]|nr:HEAT repeat domain-containing protein [Planctomycetota bacterium]
LLWLEWVDRRERWLIEEWPRVHDELGNDQAERTMEMLRTLSQERLYRDEVSQGMAWLLQDDDQRIRIVAIRTLGHLDGRGMVENLVPLMNDNAEPVRLAAQETLGTLAGCDLPDDVDACLRTLRVMGLCQS